MRRRLLVLLLSAVLLISVLAVAALAEDPASVYEQSCYQHGDINNDGTVDSQDAIYTLFHAIPMFQEQFPIDQDCDFNKDTVVNSKDAIHLLFAADPEHAAEYPLDGTIHRYFEPVWEWTADAKNASAKATLNCGCGDKLEVTDISITVGHLEEADCVSAGSKEYVGRFTYNGQIYIGTYTVDLPAGGGHVFNDTADCEEAVKCDHCDAQRPAKGHNWVLNAQKSTLATCYEAGVQVWECGCGATNELDIGTVAHQYVAQEPVLAEGSTCEYVLYHKCSVAGCGKKMEVERFTKHQYKVTLTGEPDCTNSGEKTYTCELCSEGTYTETVAPNGIHKWDNGVPSGSTITYTCESCSATKTAVAVQNDVAISKETLENADSVDLAGGTTVSLDDATVDALQGNVKISVTEADLTGVSIDAEKLAQIGDNKVYDFKLSDDTGNLTQFGGKITVSLPYVLDGDNIESIDVWYIGPDGTPERMDGEYSNGYVTFTTDHFSYYTVTRLTPKERCARYGHTFVTTLSQATCTEDGYTLNVCQRCGHSEKTDVVKKLGHNYQNTANCTQPTCTEDGLREQECQNCHSVQSVVLPAAGHDIQKNSDLSTEASCTAAGSEHYACANDGCDFSYTVEIARKAHEYASEEVVAPTCDSKGYEKFGCTTCDKEVIRNEKAALGHDYAPAKDGWTWSKDHKEATLKMVCSHDSSHEKILSASVTEKTENSVCLGGAVTYTATVSFNLTTYTETVTATEEGLGHVPSNRWIIENDRHYRICVVCGENADVGDHSYGEKTVTTAPTCVEAGLATQACTVCGHEKTSAIEATGVHSYEDGACSVCGVAETGCKHIPNQRIVYDLSQYGACGGEVAWLSCICGEVVELDHHNAYCEFGVSTDSEETRPDGTVMSVYTHTCDLCGLEWTYKDYSVADKEKCRADWYEIDQMSMGGTQIYSMEYLYWEQNHPALVEGKTVNLKDYGLCGGALVTRTCSCGENQSVAWKDYENVCNWNYDPATGAQKCPDCGATYTTAVKEQEVGCQYITSGTITFSLNGAAVYETSLRQIYENHAYEIIDVERFGKTCEDGLKIIQGCANCDETDEYVTAYHVPVNEQSIDLSVYDLCVTKLILTTCGCPEAHKDYEFQGGSHDWAYDYWLEDSLHATCMTCEATWTQESTYGKKDAQCNAIVTEKNTWTDKNGNQLKAERTGEAERHEFTVSAKLKGQTCADGVTATYTCSDCGFVRVENIYDHRPIVSERYDLSAYGGCKSVISMEACACQAYAYWGWEELNCEFSYVTGDQNSYTTQCRICGITRREASEDLGRIDSCHYRVRESYTFSKDGAELFNFSFTPIREDHRTVSELTLKEGATTCADGYHVKTTCLTCKEVVGEYDDDYPDHSAYPVKRETVSQGQLCSDLDLVTEKCACGEIESTRLEWLSGACNAEHQGYANGYELYHCKDCGVTQKVRTFRELMEGETCRYWNTTNYVFVKDGKTISACNTGRAYVDHWYAYTFQLNGSACTEGYTATGTCVLCGDTTSWTNMGQEHHERHPVEYVDLTGYGACGGYVIRYACACGEESYTEQYEMACRMSYSYRSETDLNGVHHSYRTSTCKKCGLEITAESYNLEAENCITEEHSVVTYHLGDKLNRTIATVNRWESHDAVAYAVSLLDGATTCEDGVRVSTRCADCGYEDWYQTHGHVRAAVSSEDLSAYGSVCGGKLDLTRCACGHENGYEFSADTKCDLASESAGLWIDGAINDSQYTTEGHVGLWSEAYMYVCPVTDPQACGLKIRMARYWLKDGCEAKEYEIWQLGYDEKTGTCQKELKLETGNRAGFHDYTYTYSEETPADNTLVRVYSYVCPDCQSSYTERDTYINDAQVKDERSAVNTLNNGEPKQMTETVEYGFVYKEYRFLTSQNYTCVNADGTTFWRNHTYSYDPADHCWRTVTWSDSDGNGSTDEQESHHTEWSYEATVKASCTQPGEHTEKWACVVCDIVTSQYAYEVEPNGHDWGWSDDLQKYVCRSCKLESSNNGSGSLVLEDLTETHGKGTDYVIGFWNRGGMAINPYVSVILNDVAEGENDELVLDAISLQELSFANDGVRAISFNQAEAQAMAAEAMADAEYTGSYALRISFVPLGSADTLDYAITLDSQMAE